MRVFRGIVGAGAMCAIAIGAGRTAIADAPKPDGGKFNLTVQDKSIGTDTFRLLPDGCDSDVTIANGKGGTVTFHQGVRYTKGRLSSLTTSAGAYGTIVVTFAADKSTLKVGDKPATVQKLPSMPFAYGDKSPHLFAFLVSAYDTKKGGEQKFELVYSEAAGPKGVVVFQAVMKAPVTATKQVGGKPLAIMQFPLVVNGAAGPISMDITTDKERHILLWHVPAQKYFAVREGFKDLAK
jgi:hypothetical protein